MADLDENKDGLIPLQDVPKDLDKGPRQPLGRLEEVSFGKVEDLTQEIRTSIKKEKEPDEMRIIRAKPEDVSDQDLRLLIESLIDSTLLPGSPYSREEHVEGSIRTIKKAFEKGIVLAVKDGERTIGIAAAVSKTNMPDGRPLFEFTKVSVLPEYRGQKFGSKLIEERLRLVREYFPDCPLSTATKNPKAIAVYRRLEWKEAAWGDGSEVDLLIGGKKPDGSDPKWLKEWELMREAKYKRFFFDPKPKDEKPVRSVRDWFRRKLGFKK